MTVSDEATACVHWNPAIYASGSRLQEFGTLAWLGDPQSFIHEQLCHSKTIMHLRNLQIVRLHFCTFKHAADHGLSQTKFGIVCVARPKVSSALIHVRCLYRLRQWDAVFL